MSSSGPSRVEPCDCRSFRDRIFDYQADELSEAEREAFAAHRDLCPTCAQRLEVEDGLLRAVRARLAVGSAPEDLRVRVREALRREAPAPAGPIRSWRTPWALPLAAALVLAVVGFALVRDGSDPGQGVEPFAALVTVVDFECERAGRTLPEQRQCTDPHHLNAVRGEDGRSFNLSLDRQQTRRIVTDRSMRGHVLRARGMLYGAISTLRLDEFEDLGPAREIAARLPLPPP